MASIIQLKDADGTNIYPITKTTAVFDENGNSIENKYVKSDNTYIRLLNGNHLGAEGLVFKTLSDNITRGSLINFYGDGWNQTGLRAGNDNYAGEFKVMRPGDGSADPVMQFHKYDNGTWTFIGNIEPIQWSTSWLRFSGGIQICWGWVASVGSGGTVVNYPVPFNFVGSIVALPAVNNQWAYIRCEYDGNNHYNFTLRTNSSGCPCNWFAIGYWK